MQDRLGAVKAQVQAALDGAIGALPAGELRDAMAYACAGGKRIRAFLVMESARLHGVSDDAALLVAAAVEALHAYSLVHDDLPAMDDDDLRRGLPTVHVKWSEATAILAGDALQSLAFGLLADPAIGDAATRRLVAAFAQAVGGAGMVWGQALDIADNVGMDPFSDEIIGVKIQLAALFEKIQNYRRAIDVLEIVRNDCKRWIEERGGLEGAAGKRTRLLGKTVGINVKLGELYANQYVQERDKAEERLIEAVETVLREKQRRENEGVKPDEGDWMSDDEIGGALEGAQLPFFPTLPP